MGWPWIRASGFSSEIQNSNSLSAASEFERYDWIWSPDSIQAHQFCLVLSMKIKKWERRWGDPKICECVGSRSGNNLFHVFSFSFTFQPNNQMRPNLCLWVFAVFFSSPLLDWVDRGENTITSKICGLYHSVLMALKQCEDFLSGPNWSVELCFHVRDLLHLSLSEQLVCWALFLCPRLASSLSLRTTSLLSFVSMS